MKMERPESKDRVFSVFLFLLWQNPTQAWVRPTINRTSVQGNWKPGSVKAKQVSDNMKNSCDGFITGGKTTQKKCFYCFHFLDKVCHQLFLHSTDLNSVISLKMLNKTFYEEQGILSNKLIMNCVFMSLFCGKAAVAQLWNASLTFISVTGIKAAGRKLNKASVTNTYNPQWRLLMTTSKKSTICVSEGLKEKLSLSEALLNPLVPFCLSPSNS